MPLIQSDSDDAVAENIRTESKVKPHDQAVAIALETQRRAGKKSVKKASGEDGSAGTVTFAPHVEVHISPSEVESEGVDAKDRAEKGLEEQTDPSMENFMEEVAKAGGEGSRGGNVVGHTPSGKPVYASASWMKPDNVEHIEEHPHGTYHVENQGAGHRGVLFTPKRARKPQTIAGASSLEGAKARIDSHVAKYNADTSKHLPAAGATGVTSMFGPTAGTGFGQGAAVGRELGAEAMGPTVTPPTALAGQAQRVASAGVQSLTAPITPATHSAPAAHPAPAMGGQSAGMGIGAHSKSVGEGYCGACKAGTCSEHVDKALTSRSLAIPVYMRQPAYDANGVFRSATTQTNRMYTGIAPPVAETLQGVKDSEDIRLKRVQDDLKRSQEIAELRTRLLHEVRPRGEVRWGR